MKIEKINDNQIRCTLTREDLARRELKISELVYGSEKAKTLFRDMMKQANYEFGFEADDIPLMIEAIPMSAESIVLIITKVEDPEELNPRLARFAPSATDEEEESANEADEIMDLFQRIQDASEQADSEDTDPQFQEPPAAQDEINNDTPELSRVFSFKNLTDVMDVARVTGAYFHGENALYKTDDDDGYLLVVTLGNQNKTHFSKLCNILSEYGRLRRDLSSSKAFLEEHYSPLIPSNALARLCSGK